MIRLLFIFLSFSALLHAAEEFDLVPPKGYPVKCEAGDTKLLLGLLAKVKAKTALTDSESKDLQKLSARIAPACVTKDQEQDLRAAFRWLNLLPCDPAAFKGNVRVILSSESHNFRPRALVREFLAKGRKRKAYVAIETHLERAEKEDSHVNLFADDEEVFALAFFFVNLDSITTRRDQFVYFWGRFIGIELPVWNLLKPHADAEVERLRVGFHALQKHSGAYVGGAVDSKEYGKLRFDTISKMSDPKKTWFKYYRDLSDEVEIKTGSDREREDELARLNEKADLLATALLTAVRERMQQKDFIFHKVAPQIIGKASLIDYLAGWFKELWIEEAVLGWRNRLMAYTVLDQICQAGLSGTEEVILHGGAAHTMPVFDQLNTTLKNSEAEKRVEIQVDFGILLNPPPALARLEAFKKVQKDFERVPKGQRIELDRR